MRPRTEYTWDGAAASWERLGRLNRAAWIASMRAMSPEDSIRVFEELSAGLEVPRWRAPKPPPLVLFRQWKP